MLTLCIDEHVVVVNPFYKVMFINLWISGHELIYI